METLLQWEHAASTYETKYDTKLNNEEKVVALRRIMPAEVFGGGGGKSLFRGRGVTQYDDIRVELCRYVRYVEDRPIPTAISGKGSS